MATKRTYSCDLCRTSMELQSGIGIRWNLAGEGETIERKPVRDTETHICNKCVRQLQEMFLKTAEAPL